MATYQEAITAINESGIFAELERERLAVLIEEANEWLTSVDWARFISSVETTSTDYIAPRASSEYDKTPDELTDAEIIEIRQYAQTTYGIGHIVTIMGGALFVEKSTGTKDTFFAPYCDFATGLYNFRIQQPTKSAYRIGAVAYSVPSGVDDGFPEVKAMDYENSTCMFTVEDEDIPDLFCENKYYHWETNATGGDVISIGDTITVIPLSGNYIVTFHAVEATYKKVFKMRNKRQTYGGVVPFLGYPQTIASAVLLSNGNTVEQALAGGGGGGLFEIVECVYEGTIDTEIGPAVKAVVNNNKIPIIKVITIDEEEILSMYLYLQQTVFVGTTEEYDFLSAIAQNESVVTTYISGMHISYDDNNGWAAELLWATVHDQGNS